MKTPLLLAALSLLATTSFAQQGPAYVQPMSPNGGTLRPSQFWIDPTGQNDLDSDAIAWENFTLTQTTTITTVRWWGEAPPALGFEISFFNQDPNTTACQPDIFAAGSAPLLQELHSTFSQSSAGGALYQFEVQLNSPITFQANTRYFVSVLGQQPIAFAYWNWAQSPAGTNGTFWWQRGLHMYFNLADNRAVALASSAGWATGTPFCSGDSTSTPCPCANPAVSPNRGCNNSSNTGGATLAAAGNPSLALDTLHLFSANQRPTGTSILLQGDATTATPATFGQGLRCIAGSLKRLYTKNATLGASTYPEPSDASITSRSAALGDPILPNQHRYYLVYYRDPIVLGACPATSTFNATNSLDLLYTP
ncbi:MAG: hypothetical protein IPJ19_04285 [Planctomycetes bacterium]|nr:hypothetical protein [Planctomycetota bacterium]